MSNFTLLSRALLTVVQKLRGSRRNNKINKWHVKNFRPNHCSIGAGQAIYRFVTGKDVSDRELTKMVEFIAGDGQSVSDDGAKLSVVLKALRKLGAEFTCETIHEMKTTRRLEGKMLALGDEEMYGGEPHSILLYREQGVCWLFDCINPAGAYTVTEIEALELIEKSDADCFLVTRRV